jgi:hypothetical protein
MPNPTAYAADIAVADLCIVAQCSDAHNGCHESMTLPKKWIQKPERSVTMLIWNLARDIIVLL